jgi:hypothetical protein
MSVPHSGSNRSVQQTVDHQDLTVNTQLTLTLALSTNRVLMAFEVNHTR